MGLKSFCGTFWDLLWNFFLCVSMRVQELDLEKFEELFKTRAQGPIVDLSCAKSKVAQKAVNKVTILDANRSKNLAITLRKANKTTEEICKAIEKYAAVCRHHAEAHYCHPRLTILHSFTFLRNDFYITT